MFGFLRIAAGIAIVAGFAMLPFPYSGTEAASLPSNTTVSAIGISPQGDNVRIVGISSGRVFATTAGAPLLAEVTPPVSTRRFIGRAIIDSKSVKTAYVTLVRYGAPDGRHIWRRRTSLRARRLRQSPGLLPGTVFPMMCGDTQNLELPLHRHVDEYFTPARRPLRNSFSERPYPPAENRERWRVWKRHFVSTPVTKFAPLGPLATAGGSYQL